MGRRKDGKYLIYIVLAAIGVLLYFLLQGTVEGFEEKKIPKGVILELIGGLGNQLYIYSAGKVIEKALGTPIFLVAPSEDKQFKNIHSNIDYREILFKEFTPIDRESKEFSNKIDARLENKFWDPWSPDSMPSTDTYVWIPQQWYQNLPSIESVIPEVRGSVLSILEKKYPTITIEPDSAFIHVRRGDYTEKGNDMYLLDMDYYNKALEHLNKEENIQTYYIFSDDIRWCRQQKWGTTKRIEYVDELDELKSLYMMSQCKSGAIISNSTFSTWGAILGAYEKKSTIVYPSKWLYGASTDFPSAWIRI